MLSTQYAFLSISAHMYMSKKRAQYTFYMPKRVIYGTTVISSPSVKKLSDQQIQLLIAQIYCDKITYRLKERVSMKTTPQECGNGLGVKISKAIAKELSLHLGVIVKITIEDNHIALCPQKYSLNDMLTQITKENKHSLEWGDGDNESF